jgi:hypothetical protein
MEREFLDKLFQVLRNFVEYGNYQGKIENAVKAIHKSFPSRSNEELTLQLEECISAYKEAILLVNENLAHYSSKKNSPLEAEMQFRKKHEKIGDTMLTWIIGWIYHWHHER